MGSGQPSGKELGEEGGWEFGVSDPTSALCGGAASSPFQAAGWVTAGGGTHFSAPAPPVLTAQRPVLFPAQK